MNPAKTTYRYVRRWCNQRIEFLLLEGGLLAIAAIIVLAIVASQR